MKQLNKAIYKSCLNGEAKGGLSLTEMEQIISYLDSYFNIQLSKKTIDKQAFNLMILVWSTGLPAKDLITLSAKQIEKIGSKYLFIRISNKKYKININPVTNILKHFIETSRLHFHIQHMKQGIVECIPGDKSLTEGEIKDLDTDLFFENLICNYKDKKGYTDILRNYRYYLRKWLKEFDYKKIVVDI